MVKEKLEVLKEIQKGNELERVYYAVWRHFPEDDLVATKLAQKQLDYQKKFDSLVMKVSPNGRYCVIDWGCEIAFDEKRVSGSAFCTSYRINSIEDWSSLEELDATEGMFGEQLKALKLIKKGLVDNTPFISTVFNPLMVAAKLCENRNLVKKSIEENPSEFKEGMKIITKVMKEFSEISIDYGAAGIFLATQEATYDFQNENQFKEFGMKYDLEILNAIKNKADFNVVHIHGDNIMFDLIAQNYPVEALNWHDQLTTPSIAEGFEKFDGILMGGIEEKDFLLKTQEQELEEKIQEVIDSVNGKRIIISPGCVIPINIPDEKVRIIVDFLRK